MKKFLKISSIILVCLFVVALSLYLAYAIITKDAVLDANKLKGADNVVIICDENGNEITNASIEMKNKSVKVENLQADTVNAFIASEDRSFYKHNGLNYKRMLKALYKNITSRSFKEGASTISQQLIKNTHLSSDKTIKRKLNEIKLTKKLEKKYDKNQILEMYLNTIYFGHNCYGLQSAAQFYFDKKAEQLNLEESATIVGLLTSPNNYSPFKNPEKSIKRRNIVLKNMKDCGYINDKEYTAAVNSPLNAITPKTGGNYNDYINAVFDELEELNFNFYSLANGCTIKTYLNTSLQQQIDSTSYPCDNTVIVTDNKSGGVNAYKTSINGAKRQPGSTAKPIFVYGPAINERQVSPYTKILDEKIDFGGYSPENYDNKYHGYVTVSESIQNSYNVPAVKTLNNLTLEKAEKYLTAMNIKLDDNEKNLSLALGGMSYGLSIKELADRYSIFPNGGNYSKSGFIKEITLKDGTAIYTRHPQTNNVFSEGTCSLMNEMLIETTKKGTAKKLKTFNFDVATKTGTCGNEKGNTDAYAVSYTSDHCVAVWLGDKDNKRLDVTGGKDCCNIMKVILENLYSKNYPSALDVKTGTSRLTIDREEYSMNNNFVIADPICPKLNTLEIKVLEGGSPLPQSTKFSSPTISLPKIYVKDNVVCIELCQTKYYSYIVKRKNEEQIEVVYDGKWQNLIKDLPTNGFYEYSVTPYYFDNGTKYYGAEITLPAVNLTDKDNSQQIKVPDIANKDWFNQ